MEGMMKMVKSTLTEERALDCYLGGIDCSQVTFGEFAEQLGIDKMTARKIFPYAFRINLGCKWMSEVCSLSYFCCF